MEEITFNTAHSMLQTACRHDYIDDDDEILERFNLDKLCSRFGRFFDYDEKIIDKAARSTVYREADTFSAGESLRPELDRIYAGKSMKKAIGHRSIIWYRQMTLTQGRKHAAFCSRLSMPAAG